MKRLGGHSPRRSAPLDVDLVTPALRRWARSWRAFAYAYVLSRIDGDASVFLYELEVDERFSRRGLGRELVEQARALAERVGALKMWVETDYDNEAAKHTYAASGGQPSAEPILVYGWRFR